jgi:hypothetical protein
MAFTADAHRKALSGIQIALWSLSLFPASLNMLDFQNKGRRNLWSLVF